MFDYEKNAWTELAPMQNELALFGMTTLNENIFVAGGRGKTKIHSSVWKYSPQTNNWTEVKEMNKKRKSPELVTLNDKIYAIGGEFTKNVECYNSTTDEWSYVASTNNIHNWFGATLHQNKIFILSHNGFEVYDPNSNTWEDLPKLDIGRGTQLVSINDKLWAVGGGEAINKGTASKTVYEFDENNNSWNKLPDMDVARLHHRAVVVNF